MKSKRALFSSSTVLFVLCVFFGSLHAQPTPPYFIDDFEDGSATDGMPVTWIPEPNYATGNREVINGDYVLSPTVDEEMDSEAEGVILGDVSVRTKFRVLGLQWAGVYARSSFDATGVGQSVWGAINPFGVIYIGRAYTDASFGYLDQENTGWDPRLQDVYLQLDVFGSELSLTAWLDGMDKPAQPQLTADISFAPDLTEGRVGLFMAPNSSSSLTGNVAFRWYAAVPEPASFGMSFAGLLGLLFLGRRSARQRD